MKTVISIKIDKDLKTKAARLAEEMGFNLSSIISATLRHFVVNKEINISLEPKMTPYLESVIERARKEAPEDGSPIFNNAKDLIDWLDKEGFRKNK